MLIDQDAGALAAQFTARVTVAAPPAVVMPETWNDSHDELVDRYPTVPAAASCGVENPAGTVMLIVPGCGFAGAVYLNTNTSALSPAVERPGVSFKVPGFAVAACAALVAVSGTSSPATAIASTGRAALPVPRRNQCTRRAIMSGPHLQ